MNSKQNLPANSSWFAQNNGTLVASPNASATDPRCPSINTFFNLYANVPLNIFGISFNAVSTITFAVGLQRQQMTENMYRFLLVKSASDLFMFSINLYTAWFFCPGGCPESRTFAAQIWYVGAFYYATPALVFYTTFIELAAIFDRYITINPHRSTLRFMQTRAWFYAFSVVTFPLSMLLFLFKTFEYKIVALSSSSTSGAFATITNAAFLSGQLDTDFRLVTVVLRDLVGMGLTVVINLLVLATMRKRLAIKSQMIQGGAGIGTQSQKDKWLRKKEQRVTVMVLLTGFVFIVTHTPMLVYSLCITLFSYFNCFFSIARFIYLTSYFINLVFYYNFNYNFKNVFLGLVAQLTKCLLRREIVLDQSQRVNKKHTIFNNKVSTEAVLSKNGRSLKK